jgi:uncharacterized protein YbjT (DUF2867 family)
MEVSNIRRVTFMVDILVIGASSGTGLETVKRALEEGHRVRAFARSAGQIRLDDPNLERFTGDAIVTADVRGALSGIDVVIQTLGVKAGPEMVMRGTKLFSKATRVLVEAMRAEGISRLVALTGFGAGDSRNQGGCLYDLGFNAILGRVYDDKNVQEHLIRSSDLAWTIARPVILTDRPATHRYRVVLDPADWGPGTIARADVADFLVQQVTSEKYLRKAPVLIG